MDKNKARNSFGTFQKDEAADAETQNVQRKNPFEEVGEKHTTMYFAKGYLSGGNIMSQEAFDRLIEFVEQNRDKIEVALILQRCKKMLRERRRDRET